MTTDRYVTEAEADRIVAMARGRWQRRIARDMAEGWTLNPVSTLAGKAATYSQRYQQSFTALLDRMRAAGIVVAVAPGPKGGMHSAHYTAIWPVAE